MITLQFVFRVYSAFELGQIGYSPHSPARVWDVFAVRRLDFECVKRESHVCQLTIYDPLENSRCGQHKEWHQVTTYLNFWIIINSE